MTIERTRDHKDGRAEQADRIVVGFDGSRFGWEALRWAADEAGRRRASLEIVLCTPGVPEMSVHGGPAIASAQDVVDEATQVASRRGWQIQVHASVASGSPGDALVDRARGAALLVLGEHDPVPVAPPGRESLSDYCRSHASCPVMVVTSVSQPAHPSTVGIPIC
jgi:nucleotide-binding universal stress UspA family protein